MLSTPSCSSVTLWEETAPVKLPTIHCQTSKYLEEKKSTEIPLVAASERGTALKHIFN